MYIFYFEKLEVWQKSRLLVVDIYTITKQYPSSEKFNITNQIQRAVCPISKSRIHELSLLQQFYVPTSPYPPMNYKTTSPINKWSEDDQPREKLLLKGKGILSDAELIAILLRSGNRGQSAVGLAKVILSQASNDLNRLAKFNAGDLIKIQGVGTAKATSIISALELGRRRKEIKINKRRALKSSRDVHEYMKDVFYDLQHEEFWIIVLSRSNDIICRKKISQGGVSGTVADNKIIFKYVLEELGSSIIVLHNHPSGNLSPSKADEELTKKIKMASKNLDISLLDHLIIHNEEFFSFADEGLL